MDAGNDMSAESAPDLYLESHCGLGGRLLSLEMSRGGRRNDDAA